MKDVKDNYFEFIKSTRSKFKELGITQEDIGMLVGLTRQSIAKIYEGEYIHLSLMNKEKIDQIRNSTPEKIAAIVKLNKQFEDFKNKTGMLKRKNIDHLTNILKYIKYWVDNPNLGEDYLEFIRFQVENFHMRLNPYHLFFNIYFDKKNNLLLTFDIDYEKKIIKKLYVQKTIEEELKQTNIRINYMEEWNKKYNCRNLDFEIFIESLVEFSRKWGIAYNIYIDHIDNQLDFIKQNVKSKTKKLMESIRQYDISKLFATEYQFIPVEDVIDNYLPTVNKQKVLSDSKYRNEKLSELLRIITGSNYRKEDRILSIMKSSDTDNYTKSNAISQQVIERRKIKSY